MARSGSWQSKSRHVESKTNQFVEAEFTSLLDSGQGEAIMRSFLKILRERFVRKIRDMKIGHEGDLQDSFRTSFSKGSSQLSGRINYNYYGRFVDMGVGKGVTQRELNGGRWLTNKRKGNRRKPKPWYTQTLPYEIHRLGEIYGEAVQQDLTPQVANALNINVDLKI